MYSLKYPDFKIQIIKPGKEDPGLPADHLFPASSWFSFYKNIPALEALSVLGIIIHPYPSDKQEFFYALPHFFVVFGSAEFELQTNDFSKNA